jgi:hypothetical protein
MVAMNKGSDALEQGSDTMQSVLMDLQIRMALEKMNTEESKGKALNG